MHTLSASIYNEEKTLCTLCDASKGMHLNGNNWKSQISMTEAEYNAFNVTLDRLMTLFLDRPMAFAISGNEMCFVSARLSDEFSL